MSTWTEVHSAPSQEVSMLTEMGMPNKPGTGQRKDEGENKTPRTNWNSEGAFLKSKDSVCFNKLFSQGEGRENKQANTNGVFPPLHLLNFPEG